jgi:hypothetical protein
MLPPHIMVDSCMSMKATLAKIDSPKQRTTELFLICIQLHHQLSAFHRRGKLLRDISVDNVVSSVTGTERRWTLLEYSAVAGVGQVSQSVRIRDTPPEVRPSCMHACMHACHGVISCCAGWEKKELMIG